MSALSFEDDKKAKPTIVVFRTSSLRLTNNIAPAERI